MKRRSRVASLIVTLALGGCYHQVVQTGRTPSTVVVSHPWTATWLWGLVPPEEINVSSKCQNGVATVETQQSFVNGLVTALTLGIYAPRDVRITCAST
jgi:Bor protein